MEQLVCISRAFDTWNRCTTTMKLPRTGSTLAILALGVPYAAALAAELVPSPDPVALGDVTLNGGVEKVEIDVNALPSGSGPQISGKITNGLGEPVTAVTVSLCKDKEDPNATKPSGGDFTVTESSTSSATTSASSTNSGTTGTQDFGKSGGQVADLPNGGTYDLDIDVTDGGSGSTITVKISAHTDGKSPDPALSMDMLSVFDLSGNSPGKSNSHGMPVHDRAYARLTNVDRNQDDLTGLAGEVHFDSSDSTSISSIGLYDLITDQAVAGASVGITGDTFEITGFTPLKPASSYYLSVVFSGVPAASYTIEVNGDF